MVLRILKYLFLGVLLVFTLLLLIVVTSSKMSMDSNFSHTNASKDLQKFSSSVGDGIVNISAGEMTFRARIAGFDTNNSKEVVILLLLRQEIKEMLLYLLLQMMELIQILILYLLVM